MAGPELQWIMAERAALPAKRYMRVDIELAVGRQSIALEHLVFVDDFVLGDRRIMDPAWREVRMLRYDA
jgi:hypothetical protein